jgi:hypothetical protein
MLDKGVVLIGTGFMPGAHDRVHCSSQSRGCAKQHRQNDFQHRDGAMPRLTARFSALFVVWSCFKSRSRPFIMKLMLYLCRSFLCIQI